jgi:hypothetical protein
MQSFFVKIPINLLFSSTIGSEEIQFSSIKLYASLFQIHSLAVINFLDFKLPRREN